MSDWQKQTQIWFKIDHFLGVILIRVQKHIISSLSLKEIEEGCFWMAETAASTDLPLHSASPALFPKSRKLKSAADRRITEPTQRRDDLLIDQGTEQTHLKSILFFFRYPTFPAGGHGDY